MFISCNEFYLNDIYFIYPIGHGTFFEHWQVNGSRHICVILAEHSKNGFPT